MEFRYDMNTIILNKFEDIKMYGNKRGLLKLYKKKYISGSLEEIPNGNMRFKFDKQTKDGYKYCTISPSDFIKPESERFIEHIKIIEKGEPDGI